VRTEWAQRFGDEPLIYGAQGCELCGNTGYRGRIGFYEVLKVDPTMRRLMSQRRPFHELAAAAMQGGMRTLKQDGIEKALAGHCDMREVRAATV
jgi:type II secretory ATPase GspE/PulE/Tfp pilus assembly ATPase PilB-like protein